MATAVDIINAAGREAQPAARLAYVKAQLVQLPDAHRRVVETLLAWQEATMEQDHALREFNASRRDRLWLARSGAGALVLMIIVSLAVPNPTPFQERIFVYVVALAFGACGALLPGAISVTSERPTLAVRAVGAVGMTIFAVLFYWLIR